MSDLIEVSIREEDSDECVKLKMTAAQYARATTDHEYLISLLRNANESTAEMPLIPETLRSHKERSAEVPLIPETSRSHKEKTVKVPLIPETWRSHKERTAEVSLIPDTSRSHKEKTVKVPLIPETLRSHKERTAEVSLIPETSRCHKERTVEVPLIPEVQLTPVEPRASYINTNNNENEDSNTCQFIWKDNTVLYLLSLFEERQEQFEFKRHKKIYDDIARKIMEKNPTWNITGTQCQAKINGLKKTYKKIIDHNKTSGNNRVSWPFFERMDHIFGKSGWAHPVTTASEAGPEPENIPPNVPAPTKKGKRKLETIFEEYLIEKKKLIEERNAVKKENAEKLLNLRKEQHKEKMSILKALLDKNNN